MRQDIWDALFIVGRFCVCVRWECAGLGWRCVCCLLLPFLCFYFTIRKESSWKVLGVIGALSYSWDIWLMCCLWAVFGQWAGVDAKRCGNLNRGYIAEPTLVLLVFAQLADDILELFFLCPHVHVGSNESMAGSWPRKANVLNFCAHHVYLLPCVACDTRYLLAQWRKQRERARNIYVMLSLLFCCTSSMIC